MSTTIQEIEALANAGRWDEAAARSTDYCRQAPGDPRAWFLAARIERQRGRLQQAVSHYRQAATLAPDANAVLFEYGLALQAAGDIPQATALLQQLSQREPGNAAVMQTLGGLLCQGRQFDAARQCFERALQIKPDLVEALLGLCTVWSAQERPDQVVACLERAIAIRPQAPDLHYNLGLILENMGRLDEAYQACERCLSLSPEYAQAIALQSGIRRRQGRHQEAAGLIEPLLQRGNRHPRLVDAFVNLCHRLGRCDEAVAMARGVCASPGIYDQDRMCLHFSTGQALDRLGRYDEAFAHFDAANRIRKAGDGGVEGLRQHVDAIIAAHDRDPGEGRPHAAGATPKMIFIIGMPRSGTTLVEQILASHPDVYGAGELTAMHEVQNAFVALAGTRAGYPQGLQELDDAKIARLREAYLSRLPAAGRGAPMVTDKQPGNFLAVGLIRVLFPEAVIVHCTRNPRDTCLSCYFNNFSGLAYTYDLTLLGKTWRQYDRLMQHWKALSVPMFELSYEAMVDNMEALTRSLLAYCGLDWNDTCLRFHETRRAVATVSHDQVNRPIYTGSVARWKHYEKHLGPLLAALNGTAAD